MKGTSLSLIVPFAVVLGALLAYAILPTWNSTAALEAAAISIFVTMAYALQEVVRAKGIVNSGHFVKVGTLALFATAIFIIATTLILESN